MPDRLLDSDRRTLLERIRPAAASLQRPLALALPAIVLAGCAAGPSLRSDSLSQVNSKPLPAAPPQSPQAPGAAVLGLQPLPSPAQVTAAVPLGRLDPFVDPRPPQAPPAPGGASGGSGAAGAPGASAGSASASAAASGRARRPGAPVVASPLPLDLTGVIQTGGRPAAIVQLKDNSGTLVAGERGGADHPFLPGGWKVDSININAGEMVLRHGATLYRYGLSTL